MAKFSTALLATLVGASAAFAPTQQSALKTALHAKGFEEVGGVPFDPLSLAKLGTGESFDTFPNMFPNEQFLKEAEIKHGRQAMLAWTGVWATHKVWPMLFWKEKLKVYSSCRLRLDRRLMTQHDTRNVVFVMI